MNSRLIFAAALLAACPLALHAQADATPHVAPPKAAPLTSPAAPAVTLRYKFAVGQVHRYEYDMAMEMLMQTGQTGAGMPMDMTTKMTMIQTVKSIRPADGAATIVTQIETMHMMRGGQEVPLPEAQSAKMKQPFTQVMLPTGKILSMEAPGLSGMGAPGMDFSKGMFSNMAALPDGPVKVGDIWSGSGTAAMMGLDIATASTLSGIDQANGDTLATIQSKQNGTMNKTMTQGPVPMKINGPIVGQTSQIFDTSTGTLQSAKGTTSADMTMTFPKSADGTTPPGMPSAMKMQMQMKFQMLRLSDTPPVQ